MIKIYVVNQSKNGDNGEEKKYFHFLLKFSDLFTTQRLS